MEDFERWFRYPFSHEPQSAENHISQINEQVKRYQSEVKDLQEQLSALSNEVTRLREQISHVQRYQTQHSTLAVTNAKQTRDTSTSPTIRSVPQANSIYSKKKGRM